MKPQDHPNNGSLLDYIGLTLIPGVGEIRFRRFLEHFKTPSDLFSASVEEIADVAQISFKQARIIKEGYNVKEAELFLEKLTEYKIGAITYEDYNYPESLKSIYNPPPILFYKGDISLTQGNSIAIVGSRKATAYGRSMAEKISSELVRAGIIIVSGFARGIDSISHRSALEHNGGTIAVMGCGLDIVYPPENKNLFGEIVNRGCALSEFLPGVPPEGRNFPKRNRLISGLSLGVVIIEAGIKSGALLTASHALEQGKDVFAVPGPANSASSEGANFLIKSGAKLTTSADDILEELKLQFKTPLFSQSEKRTMEGLNDTQKLIYEALGGEGLNIDKLALKVGLEIPALLNCLLEMELSGYVRSMPGKRYARS